MTGTSKTNSKVLQLIQQCAQRLRSNTPADYDKILASIGDAKVVMIGEASHGIFLKKNYFNKKKNKS
jgi:erythromycin esterase-like protein